MNLCLKVSRVPQTALRYRLITNKRSYLTAAKALSTSINVVIQGLSKIAVLLPQSQSVSNQIIKKLAIVKKHGSKQ